MVPYFIMRGPDVLCSRWEVMKRQGHPEDRGSPCHLIFRPGSYRQHRGIFPIRGCEFGLPGIQ